MSECNGKCHEAGERGVYFDLDCPKHVLDPIREWLDATDDDRDQDEAESPAQG